MNKIALITGATSGIGLATARLLANHNIDLIICGRRKERLEEIRKELEKKVKVVSLSFDVRNRNEVEDQIRSLSENWKNIQYLINNAGNAHGLAAIQEGNINDWDDVIDINVKGLLYVSNCVIPGMVNRKSGHIINLGSIAGKEVYPKGNVYCASKSAVESITEGMRMDLINEGIKVSIINPGMVDTEFSLVRFKGDEAKAKSVYKGIEALKAEDIADVIYFIISRPSHVNISDLGILPSAQASAVIAYRGNNE